MRLVGLGEGWETSLASFIYFWAVIWYCSSSYQPFWKAACTIHNKCLPSSFKDGRQNISLLIHAPFFLTAQLFMTSPPFPPQPQTQCFCGYNFLDKSFQFALLGGNRRGKKKVVSCGNIKWETQPWKTQMRSLTHTCTHAEQQQQQPPRLL